MGTDNLHHKRKINLQRYTARRNATPRILILCEGEETEVNYFNAFPTTFFKLEVRGKGFNTKSLIKFAREQSSKAQRNKLPYYRIWCVFDRDSFLREDVNAAIAMAEASGFKVAFSNESFEVWYLLHFEFLNTGIDRSQYKDKLSFHLGSEYKKNSIDMYDRLKSRQDQAIKHAKLLITKHHQLNPADMIPSTTVHLLVEELNKLVPPV